MSKDTGGPAFPLPFIYDPDMGMNGGYVDGVDAGVATGVTIRDYFAGKAMQAAIGLLNSNSLYDEAGITYSRISDESYKMADAMLKARGE